MSSHYMCLLVGLVYVLWFSNAQDLKLVLNDEFKTFDFNLWKHEITLSGGGNWEFEYYGNNRSNSYVRDGILYINPTTLVEDIGEANLRGGYNLDVWGGAPADRCTSAQFYGCFRTAGAGGNILNPIKSAALRTAESFTFKYGKVEVRAKLPKGDWLWPAIWLLPRYNSYGNWPASGEIDIMESRGNAAGYSPGGRNKFGSTLHWGPDYSTDNYPKTHQVYTYQGDLSDDFHVYGLIWNQTYIGTYIDSESQVVLSHTLDETFWDLGGWGTSRDNPWKDGSKNAPFDQEMYLIINLAVGGTSGFFPDGFGKPWSNTNPNAVNQFWGAKDQWLPTWTQPMMVDYVKVWSYQSDGTPKNSN